MSERVIGTMVWVDGEKGYGFLVDEEGKEVFVHYVAKAGEGFRILMEGGRFKFTVEDGPKGRTAIDIVDL